MKTCQGLRASATSRSNSSGVRLSGPAVAGDRVAGDVDGEVADAEPLGLGLVVAAQPGAHPGDELLGLERLHDVVVGAGLQAHDDVDGVGLGRQHDDRHAGLGPDLAADLEAVDAREHDVEEHQVGAVVTERADGGRTRRRRGRPRAPRCAGRCRASPPAPGRHRRPVRDLSRRPRSFPSSVTSEQHPPTAVWEDPANGRGRAPGATTLRR